MPKDAPGSGRAHAPVTSPLLAAALGLVPPAATESELEHRFSDQGADLRPGTAAQMLRGLAGLGLVRASRVDHGAPRYVLTGLGQRALDAGIEGEAGIHLRELEALRTDLLSTIAHELRTPLTALRTSASLLLDETSDPTPDQRRSLLESIARSGERMQRLVGDVLDLSRFRSGSVTLQLRRFNAAALADSAIAVVAPLAAIRGQRIDRVSLAEREHAVYGDHRRLEQALLNLVSNAQRFTPDEGTITVRVAADARTTTWSVTDGGPGITPDDQARLFERFFVGRNDRNSPQQGVGLGLPIALAIAQAHGGTIDVESEVGRGSTFSLVVPTHGPEDEA